MRTEEEVVEAAWQWLDVDREARAAHLPTVMGAVQWELVRTEQCFTACLADPLLRDLHSRISQAFQYFNMNYEEKLLRWKVSA